MAFQKESDMYPLVCEWLNGFLNSRYRNTTIRVFDTSRKSLARLIQEKGLSTNLPSEWHSWDIFVDIVGFAVTKQKTDLTFVECKNTAITLRDVSQLLGYSRVALPQHSFIIAPQGASDSLRELLLAFNRIDILRYHTEIGKLPHSIVVAQWDETANCIDAGSIVTGDRNRIGKL